MTPELLSELLNVLDDAFFVVDANAPYCITNVSKGITPILNYEPEDLTGKNISELVHPEDFPIFQAGVEKQAFEFHFHAKHQTGYYVKIFQHGKRIKLNGKEVLVGYWKGVEESSPYLQWLLDEKEKFEGIVKHSPQTILMVDEDLRIKYVNTLRKNFQIEQVIGKSCLEFVLDSHHYTVQKAVQYVFDTGHFASYEIEGYGDNYDIRWYKTQLAPVYQHGRIRSVTLTTEDITASKKAARSLREIQETLDHAQRIAHLGSWTLDVTNNSIIWSPELFNIYERDIEQGPASSDWFEYIHLEDLKKIKKHSNLPLLKKHPLKHEYRIVMADGRVKYIQAESELVYDENGQLIKIVGTELDISELKTAQLTLLEEESKFRAIIENTTDIIFILNETGIKYASPQVHSVIGYPNEELLSFAFLKLVQKEDHKPITKTLKQAFNSPKKTLFIEEFRLQKSNGNVIHMEGLISYLPDVPGVEGVVINCRDITQRVEFEKEKHRLENELSQAKKMETIGTLAGGIAHDFKNILMPIIGYTNIVMEDLKEKGALGSIKDLQKVLTAANRANELVKQILTFSHKADIEKKPVSVSKILEDSINLLRATIPSSINFVQEVNYRNIAIEADFTQIQQVLMNLCTNAYHAMQENGGQVTVSVQKATDSRSQPHLDPFKTYALITIEDTGHGIPPENLERIFDPFYTTKSVGQGTGLGLSVAQGIIHNHKGSISVKSEIGRGTTFFIYLPTVKATLEKEVEEELRDYSGNERILFIDDEEMTREIVKRILERSGYQVYAFSDGVNALQAFELDPDHFDLVITDQTMPKISGLDIAASVKEIKPETPVLLISGSTELLEMDLTEKGVDSFVMKPVNPNHLLQLVFESIKKKLKTKRSIL